MVLPLVPLVLISSGAVSGVSGVVLGVKGGYDLKRANTRIREAGERYASERRQLEAHEAVTNDALRRLGARQEAACSAVVERMADFLRRNEKAVSQSEKLLVDGLEPTPGQVALEAGLGQDAIAWVRGIVGSAATGVGINAGVTAAVATFASASTGTAISTLSGAAATNATLAFLGGGSLASGGGGMVAGAAALNIVTVGPALLVSGCMVAGQGEKAKTRARENEAAVSVAIAEARETKAKFDAIIDRTKELGRLLDHLQSRAVSSMDLLESEPFVPSVHGDRFRQALELTMAVRDVAASRVVNETGGLNEATSEFKVRYRRLIKEAEGG